MILFCDAIPEDEKAARRAYLPIEHLAERGNVEEALRHVNGFLHRLRKHEDPETVCMAELGAKICLTAGDLARMEDFLAIGPASQQHTKRKSNLTYAIDSVRDFRANNGLLDPSDAVGEKQRLKARFERAFRQLKQAVALGDSNAAKVVAAEMLEIALEVNEDVRKFWLKRLAYCYAELSDQTELGRFLNSLGERDHDEAIDDYDLAKLGMKAEAIKRAQQDIALRLEDRRHRIDWNIHGCAHSIGNRLQLLVSQGAKEEARFWLYRTIEEMPTWPAMLVVPVGWTTSAVYRVLGEAMNLIDGPVAAESYLKQAMADAKAEKDRDSRKAAEAADLMLMAEIGKLNEAIDEARKLRSLPHRRKTLAILLAKAKRWDELREVVSQVAFPEEAADIAWWIKFELPGGRID